MIVAAASGAQLASTALRLLLAVVFLVACVAKARDMAATRTAVAGLGVPARFGRAAASGVVIAEAVVAACLVVNATALVASVAAVTLLSVFSALVVVSLSAGRRPPCNCFGSSSSAPIGMGTLVRNGVLVAMAVTLVVRRATGGPSALGGVDRLDAAQALVLGGVAVAVVVLGAHTWFILQIVRQNGRLLERVELLESAAGGALPRAGAARRVRHVPHDEEHRAAPRRITIGSMAPRFGGRDVDGRPVSIDDLRSDGRPVVMVFLETHCAACVELAADVNARAATSADRMLVAVVHGERNDVATLFSGPGFDAVLVDGDGEIADRYDVGGSPTALLVLPDGRVASGHAEGRAAVTRLVGASLVGGAVHAADGVEVINR